jgi:hypothetical protein
MWRATKCMDSHDETIILIKDNEWSQIEGKFCRVLDFTPFAQIINGKIKCDDLSKPYCSILIEIERLPLRANGFITHKIDFSNLWKVFRERGVNENEEVNVVWTRKQYKTSLTQLFPSGLMPKLIVMIYPKNFFDVLTDPNKSLPRTLEEASAFLSPIVEYKPDIME